MYQVKGPVITVKGGRAKEFHLPTRVCVCMCVHMNVWMNVCVYPGVYVAPSGSLVICFF